MEKVNFTARRQALRLCVVVSSVVMTVATSGWRVVEPEVGFSNLKATSFMIGSPVQVDSLGRCYNKCIQEMACMSLFFNRNTKMCQLHDIVFLSTKILSPEDGFDYYRFNDDTCKRDVGYMLNRKLGICFALISFNPSYSLESTRSLCQTETGGRLMIIDSNEKHVLVTETTRAYTFKSVFIGLTRTTLLLPWRWEDNRALTWSQWTGGQPTTGADEYCVQMGRRYGWDWMAKTCSPSNNKLAACEPGNTTIT